MRHLIAYLLFCSPLLAVAGEAAENSPQLTAQFRRPVALGLLADGTRLAVANRGSGGVSLLNTKTWKVINEFPAGKNLSDLAVLPDRKQLLVTDETGHKLIALHYADNALQVTARLPVSRHPVEVVLNAAGTRAYVASLWSRQVTVVDIAMLNDSPPAMQVLNTIDLPFEPRKLLFLEDAGKLIVADSFGGQLAVLDAETAVVDSIRELPAHNIRGLTLNTTRDAVLISHERLNKLARTDFDDLHWGILANNVIRTVAVTQLIAPGGDLLADGGVLRLGDAGNGAADPAEFAALKWDRIAVAWAGTGEVALTNLTGKEMRRYKTGRRPTALLSMPESDAVIVANTLSDSISVVRPRSEPPVRTVSLGPNPAPSPQLRGELLFFDAELSHDRWLSCHSCHTDGHTSSILVDTLGDGSYGAPKRVPTLLGVGLTDLWAWNGSMKELHDQVDKSIRTTMHGDDPRTEDVNDIVAYLQSLSPPPPLRPPTSDAADQASLARGRELFRDMNCIECHVPPVTYTTGGAFDVGLEDEVGNRKFNPPSLRGVGRRRGFFHDKRAKTLDAVFTDYGHQLDRDLDAQELRDLIRFLESL